MSMKQKVKSAQRMKIEGAGPKIMAPLFVMFAIAAWISYTYRPTFDYPLVPAEWTLALGALCLLVGVPFWLLSTGMFLLAYFRGRLETRGPFAVMPNPIYGSWIVFVLPGISLVLNWWPILLTSVVMYIAQRIFIHAEDDALREKFGRQYEEYRRDVLVKFL
jgi:protein-S-isoprenylcysteine O-methyltransferase Ste14